ncbi:hypothetical protein C8R44DRAFT_981705 [Mycena epipterygia]|nr:hypothetical protein C8R44DRAFT_981705 [Mycena epipterygia]
MHDSTAIFIPYTFKGCACFISSLTHSCPIFPTMSPCIFDTTSVLPPYTPAGLVPSYSREPAHDERLIEHTPRPKSRVFNENYLKKSGRDTLILADQDATADCPTYGRQALINGFVSLDDRETVSKVVLTVKGKIDLMISERGSVTKTIVDKHYALWSAENSGSSSCPGSLPFSTILPATFDDGKTTHPLPPSYNATYITSCRICAKVAYTLAVTVTRRKLVSRQNTLSVPFNYAPRTRPSRPIQPPVSDFLADIKVMPEEWRQITVRVNPRPKSTLGAVYLHLFIPSIEIFALCDTIPFHIQLTGPVDSLREFLPAPADAARTTGIEVKVLRQIMMDMNGSMEPCQVAAAHSVPLSTPPGAASPMEPDANEASLDWAGELRCKADVTVGSFNAGMLKVQDFIVVDIFPPAGSKAQFSRVRHSHRIRLVTDLWYHLTWTLEVQFAIPLAAAPHLKSGSFHNVPGIVSPT